MSGTPLLKHDTLFKLGLLSGEMQSLILSLLWQWGGGGLEKREGVGLTKKEKVERWRVKEGGREDT